MEGLTMDGTKEAARLQDGREKAVPWRRWGPYLSERQWGTVREDYSPDGNAWDYFTHDQARSRAYRWGEDGLGGISDDKQRLCFALTLWNGEDPILKERLFGLTNSEGNHGEDVKEYYFYLDSTPTHSYMKYLYKYPQAAYPYDDLVQTNRQRARDDLEYELIETGIFDGDRYFDVFVEYAKAAPEDLLIAITVWNRGPEPAALHVLPTLWFRNTWSWTVGAAKPGLREIPGPKGARVVQANHATLGEYYLYSEGDAPDLFTENETNAARLFGTPNQTPYVKDGINNYIVNGQQDAVNPAKVGTKAAAHHWVTIGPGASRVIRLRLTKVGPADLGRAYADTRGDVFGKHYDEVLRARRQEADEFYDSLTPPSLGPDSANVMRQALAGMLWTKQYYFFDLDSWLEEHSAHPLITPKARVFRNRNWFHMHNDDIISMPDKWEYPWYAAWDLAFHTLSLSIVDPDFAKDQLDLMLRNLYLHPSGQIPAYEWNFGDVNPPVHAWAILFNYQLERANTGVGDIAFLKSSFQKLLLNFTWWVNRKDPTGKNVFEGGFLGLDNIGVFDRSAPLPTGGHLEQADGTAWMAFYCQCMFEIALELAAQDSSYEEMALKFLEHFLWIAYAMDRLGEHQDEMWDEQDGFFYDLLQFSDGTAVRLKVRSLVGLLSLCASTVISKETMERFAHLRDRFRQFLGHHPELTANMAPLSKPGVDGRHVLSILSESKLRRILAHMLDEDEFLSPYGIRSVSRYHKEHPYVFRIHGEEYRVEYLPAESNTGMFGGNSNWRGPIWFPINALLIRALLQSYLYYGDDFTVECPKGSGKQMTLFEVAREIAGRLGRIFLRDASGRRPVYGGVEKFQSDPHWRDHVLFYEYFHGDNGAGIGASHQTGWTGLVALTIQLFGVITPESILRDGRRSAFAQIKFGEVGRPGSST
jgi:hypothetical protein